MANRPGAGGLPARRSQTHAAKVAAARLAQVMASHSTDNDDEDDYHNYERESAPMAAPPARRDQSPRIPRRPLIPPASEHRDASPRIGAPYNALSGGAGAEVGHRSSGSLNLSSVRSVPTLWQAPSINGTLHRKSPSMSSAPKFIPPPPEAFNEDRKMLPASNRVRDNGRDNGRGKEEAALQDEIDLLQEDNQLTLNKLRTAEERLQEMENRNKELEKQISSLGEGISLEARLLSRKEAKLREREAALKAEKAASTDMKDDEIAALRLETDAARDEVMSANERSVSAEKEVQSLRTVTRRMILTHDEMEEMVLKRCWLARYWGLATRHGILAEVASSKHEHWSALAPLPLEVVISAGHSEDKGAAGHRKTPSIRDLNDITGEGNVESMLAVEKGLRELSLLRVEQAVMLAISKHHHPSLGRSELSLEEVEDIQFKHAWLVYFWRRAKNMNVERDIADDRLKYWMVRCNVTPTSHDVQDVERGLLELHKLGVEEQLWEASRREVSRAGEHLADVAEDGA